MGQAGCVRLEEKYDMEKFKAELVAIEREILHSEVSQPLSTEKLVTLKSMGNFSL